MNNLKNIKKRIQFAIQKIDTNLNLVLAEVEAIKGSKLTAAMRYSALAPGKRLRGFLVLEIAKAYGTANALDAATALELLHSYSLVHDDLPAMDDDNWRRGRPSCHVQYGEATAMLAGNALLSFVFELLARSKQIRSDDTRLKLIYLLAKFSGHMGMIAGQAADLLLKQLERVDLEYLIQVYKLKTGKLFALACCLGGILGGASDSEVELLEDYGYSIGIAFQIADDLCDLQEDRKKNPGVKRGDTAEDECIKLAQIAKKSIARALQGAEGIVCYDLLEEFAALIRDEKFSLCHYFSPSLG